MCPRSQLSKLLGDIEPDKKFILCHKHDWLTRIGFMPGIILAIGRSLARNYVAHSLLLPGRIFHGQFCSLLLTCYSTTTLEPFGGPLQQRPGNPDSSVRVRVCVGENRIVTCVGRNVGGPLSLSCVKLLNREDTAVNSVDATHHIPTDVRAAIRAFLNACQEKGTRLATVEALDAVHRVFPELDISDADLIDAVTSEASVAGFDVEVDAGNDSNSQKRKSLERWVNEGGAIGRHLHTEAQRRIDYDTSGARPCAKETKGGNDPI